MKREEFFLKRVFFKASFQGIEGKECFV